MNPFRRLAARLRQDGIRFACTRCGACCRVPGSVFFTGKELRAAAQMLGIDETAFRERYARPQAPGALTEVHADEACPFLDDGYGCRIYAVRPSQCRSFPFWKANFKSSGALARLARACPGVGRGRFHSSDEIARRIIGAEADFHLPEREGPPERE